MEVQTISGLTHINYEFDDEKLLAEVEKLSFEKVSVEASEYKPADDGLVYLDTGSIVKLDEDYSHFEKTKNLTEGYFYEVASKLCNLLDIKKYHIKVLRYSPGDKIFSHKDSSTKTPCVINHVFGADSPIIFNQTEKVYYKTALINVSGVFHKVSNTEDTTRYTLKIIPAENTYEQLKQKATSISIWLWLA